MSESLTTPVRPTPATVYRSATLVDWIRGPGGRFLIIAIILGAIVGYPVYLCVDAKITGGIWRKGDLYVVDLKAMSLFEMDQIDATDKAIPPKWRELDGKRVQCTGEMWSPYSAGGRVAGFQLCYSIAKCCFNGPPKVQHFVQVQVPDGRSVRYYPELVKVVGKLQVGVVRSQGRVHSIYRMEVESVDPA